MDNTPRPDLDAILSVALKAGEIGNKVLTEYYGRLEHISEKEQAGLVSEADLESEKAITSFLRSEFPEFDILGEEGAYRDPDIQREFKSPGRWVIDPLDGTTNYVHQFPMYCISIGFEWNEETVVGVVNVPLLNRVYSAKKGAGAYCNEKNLKVSERSQLRGSLVATGFSSYDKAALQTQIQIFSKVVGIARGVRRAGSAAIDLCMVAEGVFDGYWERNLQAWDSSAGLLLVKEAGGLVTDYEGRDFKSKLKNVVAGNPKIQPQLLEIIKSTVESAT